MSAKNPSGWEIYHHPRCSKSRQALALLKEKGIEPEIREYLKHPPTEKELREIARFMGQSPKAFLRTKESLWNQIKDKVATDEEIIEAMAQHPILIERPIIISPSKKAVLGRPPENIEKLF